MNTYLLVKNLHLGCALLSWLGFSLRGYWMWTGSELLQHRLSRTLPHLIDSVLLLSAVALVVMAGYYPGVTDWVNLKLGLLLLYIVLGSYALKRGASLASRRLYLLAAELAVLSIFAVALLKPSFQIGA